MRKPKATTFRDLAKEIASDSIVNHALSRMIEQIVTEVHAVKQEEIYTLRSTLKAARPYVEQMQNSKHEAAARDAFELASRINAVLKGGEDE